MSAQQTNNRASLLAALRTGGVRSSSINVPHTAAPTASFNISRAPSYSNPAYFPDEEDDQFLEIPHYNHHQPLYANRAIPMTAAVDGPNNHFAQHQGRMMNPNSIPFTPNFVPGVTQHHGQPNAIQMQMLQIEMLKIQQAIQQQQHQQMQAEMLAQAQRQQQIQMQQARDRRTSMAFQPPATAGPMTNSFDLRATTVNAQMRRANQADQLRAQLGVAGGAEDQVPMTAALGGRFGSRAVSLSVTPPEDQVPPTTPSTTVISGGTSLGAAPSKSDSASSWRRGGNNNSVLSGNRAVSSPSVKITPPPSETRRISPPPGLSAPTNANATGIKFRPQPLRFGAAVAQHVPAVTIDTTTDDDTDADTQSSGSSVKSSSPTTPRSSSSSDMPLSPREEASKKLYEGLGIGRPVSATPSDAQTQHPVISVASHRMVSQPTRQPRGPPSGTEELGPKNFATRIRRKAIGGLGVLMDARERREVVEAY